MIDVDDKKELHGGIDRVIDFPKSLSKAGVEYLRNGLQTWRACTVSALSIKVEGLKAAQTDMDDYIRKEADALYDAELCHDVHLGPVSVLQASYNLKYIDVALDYLHRHKRHSDVALYEKMEDEVRMPDLDYLMPDHKKDHTITQFVRIMEKSQADMASVDDEFKCQSLAGIMRHFRCAQYDMLNPLEKKIFMHNFNARREILPIAYDAVFARDFYSLPARRMTLTQKMQTANKGYDTDIYDLVPDQIRYVLALNKAFDAVPETANNSYHFIFGQRLRHGFSMMQAYARESVIGDLSFEEFMDMRGKGLYQLTVYPNEYKTYYQDNHKTARFPLLPPDGLKNHNEIHLNYDDFTETYYHRHLGGLEQNSFDNFLQNRTDQVAKASDCPTMNIRHLRHKLMAYEWPEF